MLEYDALVDKSAMDESTREDVLRLTKALQISLMGKVLTATAVGSLRRSMTFGDPCPTGVGETKLVA